MCALIIIINKSIIAIIINECFVIAKFCSLRVNSLLQNNYSLWLLKLNITIFCATHIETGAIESGIKSANVC